MPVGGFLASLTDVVRKHLEALKEQAVLVDEQLAEEMQRQGFPKKIYQQKVNDFFSGEMKKPELDFMAALCRVLGVSLSAVISAAERETLIEHPPDWEWLMFGRRLGPVRQMKTREAIEGGEPPAAPASPLRPRSAQRKRAVAPD